MTKKNKQKTTYLSNTAVGTTPPSDNFQTLSHKSENKKSDNILAI